MDKSPLLSVFLIDFSSLDFNFQVDGSRFHRLYLLIDSIYPELERFVKAIEKPIRNKNKLILYGKKGLEKI